MNEESTYRQGEIYYGCYNRKNSLRNLLQEQGWDRVEVALIITRGLQKFSYYDDKTLGVREGGWNEMVLVKN